MYLPLPYYDVLSEKYANELTQRLSVYYPHINLKISLKNNHTIGSYFRYKDVIQTPLRSKIINLRVEAAIASILVAARGNPKSGSTNMWECPTEQNTTSHLHLILLHGNTLKRRIAQ